MKKNLAFGFDEKKTSEIITGIGRENLRNLIKKQKPIKFITQCELRRKIRKSTREYVEEYLNA